MGYLKQYKTAERRMATGTIKVTRGLSTLSAYVGDMNDLPSGVYHINDPQSTQNLPNTSNLAWVVTCTNAYDEVATFGMQIAIGYNPPEVYARRRWGTWTEWVKLSN